MANPTFERPSVPREGAAARSPRSVPPRLAVDVVRAFGRGLSRLSRRLAPPPIPLLEIVASHWRLHAIGVVARLGLADQLAAGPRDAGDLARATGVDEDALFRVLRALASEGILDRPAPRTFALNAISAPLRRDHPSSILHTVLQISSSWNQRTWNDLLETVRTGAPAFPRIFGEDLWAYFERAPADASDFHRSMRELTRLDLPAIVAAYDFGRHRSVVDLGGGSGQLLSGILAANPGLRGTIFDLATSVRDAPETLRAAGVEDRARIEVGDFRARVPPGHDLALMRHIVHGHTDAQLEPIFARVRGALTRGARFLVLEHCMPEEGEGDAPAMLDLQMLVGSGGRERTRSEFGALFGKTGFRMVDVVRTITPLTIFVAEPA
jgi:hypothetical protein